MGITLNKTKAQTQRRTKGSFENNLEAHSKQLKELNIFKTF